jgi:hypothetical protein
MASRVLSDELAVPELIQQLAAKLNIPIQMRGALQLIQPGDCGKIVEACRAERLLILGIDAFRLVGHQVIPDTDFIADFSELAAKPRVEACEAAALSAEAYFLRATGRTDLFFEFVLRKRSR